MIHINEDEIKKLLKPWRQNWIAEEKLGIRPQFFSNCVLGKNYLPGNCVVPLAELTGKNPDYIAELFNAKDFKNTAG